MHVCVCARDSERETNISHQHQHQQHINCVVCVYLEAGRRSAMWFVDVHGYKLPSPSSVFMEHLWHKDNTWGAACKHIHTHTHTKKTTTICTIKSTGRNSNTHTSALWLHLHGTSVATTKLKASRAPIQRHTKQHGRRAFNTRNKNKPII